MKNTVLVTLRKLAIAIVCYMSVVVGASPAHAQDAAPSLSAIAASCEALAAADLSRVPEAPTHLYSSKLIASSGEKPAYCEVEGNIAPQVGILMWLPAQNWNGKFMEVGCGGFCGILSYIALCETPLHKGYACITTDMGHKGKEAEGVEWAYNNPQAVIDFAYRATHVTAIAGKEIARRYYGRGPSHAYFQGCSCGGRQALVEAERFPLDFDGIIVGAPGLNYADIAITSARKAAILSDGAGKSLFDQAAIRFVDRAIVAKCDLNDGVKDGRIGDPTLCRFDPRDHICKAGTVGNCLSAQQANAIAAFSTEFRGKSGERIGERAFLPGWEASFFGLANNSPLVKRAFYEDFLKYMALVPNPGPAWTYEQFDVDTDYPRLEQLQSLLQADNPDLSRFKKAGGKLIFYHGWSDAGPSPLGSIAFYEAVEKAMGGRAATQDFLRLFMVPDMDHCMGGRGAWKIDYLDYLEKWVERSIAPDKMIGAHFSEDAMAPAASLPARPLFTRPVYPYPIRAQYRGKGDPNAAENYKSVVSGR